MSKHGIKETKEMLEGIHEITLFLITIFKDGVDFSDFGAIWDKITDDADFRAKVEAAYEGYKKIPEELKDLELDEGLELAMDQIKLVPRYVDVLRKGE